MIWIVLGYILCMIISYYIFVKVMIYMHKEFTIGDAVFVFVMSLCGPISFLAACGIYFMEVGVTTMWPLNKIDFNRNLYKEKK